MDTEGHFFVGGQYMPPDMRLLKCETFECLAESNTGTGTGDDWIIIDDMARPDDFYNGL